MLKVPRVILGIQLLSHNLPDAVHSQQTTTQYTQDRRQEMTSNTDMRTPSEIGLAKRQNRRIDPPKWKEQYHQFVPPENQVDPPIKGQKYKKKQSRSEENKNWQHATGMFSSEEKDGIDGSDDVPPAQSDYAQYTSYHAGYPNHVSNPARHPPNISPHASYYDPRCTRATHSSPYTGPSTEYDKQHQRSNPYGNKPSQTKGPPLQPMEPKADRPPVLPPAPSVALFSDA